MSSVSFKELNQTRAVNFEVKAKLEKEKEIYARIENLSAKLAKFYPTSLSKYSIVRLVQSAFIAITRFFYSTTIKNLKIELEQANKAKIELQFTLPTPEHKNKLGSCLKDLKSAADKMQEHRFATALIKLNQSAKPTHNSKTLASEACQFIQNTIANQAAPLVRLGAELKSSASKITLASVGEAGGQLLKAAVAAAPVAIAVIAAAPIVPVAMNALSSSVTNFFGSQAV